MRKNFGRLESDGLGLAKRSAKKGFTLIELLVVIAIIAILAAILFPVFARARENARRASCSSNLKQMGLAVMQYTQDYDELMPFYYNRAGIWWMDAVNPYAKSYQIWKCPSDTSPRFLAPVRCPVAMAPTPVATPK